MCCQALDITHTIKKIVSYVHSRVCVMSVAILGIGVAQLLVSLINILMVGDLLVIGDV